MKAYFKRKVFVSIATKRKNQSRLWYSRNKTNNGILTRQYEIFSLTRNFGSRCGSFYKLNIGMLCIRFGLRPYGRKT